MAVYVDDVEPAVSYQIEFKAGRSNTIVLSEEEFAIAKLLMQKSKQRIADLTTDLVDERSRLERLNVAIAQHKRLPLELLREIFLFSASNNTYPPKPTVPWTLRHVCSSWREIILSEVSIWNDVVLDHPLFQKDCERLNFWIDATISTLHPLSICIDTSYRYDTFSTQIAHSSVIVPLGPHIHTLSIDAYRDFFSLSAGFLPSLQRLSIHNIDDSFFLGGWNSSHRPTCFIDMGSLRSLHLSFSTLQRRVYVPELPFHQLTSLMITTDAEYAGLQPSDALGILRRCPLLEDCQLYLTMPKEMIPQVDPVHLSHLSELKLKLGLNQWFLDNLITPVLEKIEIEDGSVVELSPVLANVAELVLRSECSLYSVEDQSRTVSGKPNLISSRALDALSSVTELFAFEANFYTDEIVAKIASGELLPHIERSILDATGQAAIRSLTEMIERRSGTAEPHVDIHVKIDEALAGDCRAFIEDCLRRVKACGSELCVSDGNIEISQYYV
ncbi:hypothetical protein H0H87_001324 [Tephrocybe sp. NHM501043]|nr:hypothetical protein H0H87_001324 [Tephrocybe sp. NHM501043]